MPAATRKKSEGAETPLKKVVGTRSLVSSSSDPIAYSLRNLLPGERAIGGNIRVDQWRAQTHWMMSIITDMPTYLELERDISIACNERDGGTEVVIKFDQNPAIKEDHLLVLARLQELAEFYGQGAPGYFQDMNRYGLNPGSTRCQAAEDTIREMLPESDATDGKLLTLRLYVNKRMVVCKELMNKPSHYNIGKDGERPCDLLFIPFISVDPIYQRPPKESAPVVSRAMTTFNVTSPDPSQQVCLLSD